MTALTTTVDSCAHRNDVTAVWDRLWSSSHSIQKDDELLHRERESHRWRLVTDRVLRTFSSFHGLRVLELGSGRGDLATLCAEQGANVTLLDASKRALQQAGARFDRLGLRATHITGDLFHSAPNGAFDLVISSGVIEHFRGADRTAAVKAHQSALSRGGMAVISVPNAHCMPYRTWKAWLELRGSWPYGFERPYSRRELARRAREAGFQRSEVHGCGFWQSMGDQLVPLVMGGSPRRWQHESMMDHSMGLSLVLFGWNL